MIRTLLIVALSLSLAGIASGAPRVLGHPEASYELSLKDLRMPSSSAGSVTLRTCAACQSVTHRVDGATIYLAGNTPMLLPDFLNYAQSLSAANPDDRVLVGVYYDVESAVVTRIIVLDHRN